MKCGGSLIRNVYHNTDRTAPLSGGELSDYFTVHQIYITFQSALF